jgi:hypothetical protein
MRLHTQEEFAAFTSDFNPLHMDASCALVSGYRSRVVHGVNTLLCLLEEIERVSEGRNSGFEAFDASFDQAIYEDDTTLGLELLQHKATVLTERGTSLRVDFKKSHAYAIDHSSIKGIYIDKDNAEDLGLASQTAGIAKYTESQVNMLVGKVFKSGYTLDDLSASILYPFLYRSHKNLVRDLCFITYVVGTKIPGYQSVLARITYNCPTDLKALDPSATAGYYIILKKFRTQASYGRLEFFRSSGEKLANVDVFYRPTFEEGRLDSFEVPEELGVEKNWGSGKSALVIGASGGIGLEVASLLSLYGFSTTATYFSNVKPLDQRQKQLSANGYHLNKVMYNHGEQKLPGEAYDLIVDCSTPRISSESPRTLSNSLHIKLTSFYLTSISRII